MWGRDIYRKKEWNKKIHTTRFTLGEGKIQQPPPHSTHCLSSVRLYVRLALLSCNGFYWTSSSSCWRHTASWVAIMALASLRQTSFPIRFISAAPSSPPLRTNRLAAYEECVRRRCTKAGLRKRHSVEHGNEQDAGTVKHALTFWQQWLYSSFLRDITPLKFQRRLRELAIFILRARQ